MAYFESKIRSDACYSGISSLLGGEIIGWFASMVRYGTVHLGYRGIFVIW